MDATEKSRILFVLSSVLFIFTLTWALVGENNFKMIAVFIGFACFLFHSIEYEMNLRAEEAH